MVPYHFGAPLVAHAAIILHHPRRLCTAQVTCAELVFFFDTPPGFGGMACPPLLQRDIVRDHALGDFIRSKPADIRFVWFSADGVPRAWDAVGNNLIVL